MRRFQARRFIPMISILSAAIIQLPSVTAESSTHYQSTATLTTTMSSIYTGPWINWSQGAIRGAVLTLPSREGGYLTTFIATFITIVGAQLWRIISFILHQARSSSGPQDGLHHQQQNIFRNTSSPAGVAWAFALQAWYWRGRAQRLWVRTIPWVCFSLGYMLAIAAAAVFSSRTSEAAGSARLLVEGSYVFSVLYYYMAE